MKKFLYSLLVLFASISTVAFAQQEEAASVEAWDGSDKALEMLAGDKLTFEYTATGNGTFYVYSDNQDAQDNLPIDIWGGWYNNGVYEPDTLQDAGYYDNGAGVYGWLRVMAGDVVRFTLTASDDADGSITEFTLKSMFFNDNYGGSSWETPVVLEKGQTVNIPVCPNNSSEFLVELDLTNATFCKFTAPSDGVASIFTEENLIYYLEEEYIGSVDNLFKAVSQDVKTNDHEFIVNKGVDYLVVVPNSRPTTLKFKMNYDRLGLSPKFPVEISEFPATIDLLKGNNYYAFSHELVGESKMMEVSVAAGWNGTVTYMENSTEESEELAADKVTGSATTFVKNVDSRYLKGGSTVIVNFKMTDKSSLSSAVKLSLREPKAGESFETAIAAVEGENSINGPAGEYWFAYTTEKDAVYSFATNGALKHINFTAGIEQMVADNEYRVDMGETIYICVATTTAEGNVLTISGVDIVDGDYCDRPVYFELGQTITIAGRGVDNFHSFTSAENGIAVFQSTNWTVHFRGECGGRRLNAAESISDAGDDIKYTYELPVEAGKSYIVEVTAVSEDITINTSFKTASVGEIFTTAIGIESLNDTVDIAYEFEKSKWYKLTADKDGFYVIKAKLGYAANMTTKIGNDNEINAGSDNDAVNAYMGGYKAAKVYVKAGETLYIYTKTGRENDEKQFSAEFYLVASFAEARPGEDVAVAMKAEANTEYVVMAKGDEAYNQWYIYTIPADREAVFSILCTTLNYSNLSLYNEQLASLSSYKGDFVQTTVKDGDTTIGKTYEFAVADVDRTIYIYTPIVTSTEPVIWKIECDDAVSDDDDNTGDDTNDDNNDGNAGDNNSGDDNTENGVDVEEVADEAPVIYDLMGRRVMNPTKGIYIINGVKRVIK